MTNGKIYKVVHTQSNICYVGSTLGSLRSRWCHHKTDYQRFINKKNTKNISLYPYFSKYGIDNFKIILIKEYEVIDKKQLVAYEQLWINKLNPINKNASFQILSKNKKKEYYINNKEEISEKQKAYALANQESRRRYLKQYQVDNKEKIKIHKQKAYENKKEALKQIFICECGKTVSYMNKTRHNKTKYHLIYHERSA